MIIIIKRHVNVGLPNPTNEKQNELLETISWIMQIIKKQKQRFIVAPNAISYFGEKERHLAFLLS